MQYIALYLVAIVLVWGVSTALFISKNARDKKRYKRLAQKKDGTVVEVDESAPKILNTAMQIQVDDTACQQKQEQEANFEDFSLDGPKVQNKDRIDADAVNPFFNQNRIYDFESGDNFDDLTQHFGESAGANENFGESADNLDNKSFDLNSLEKNYDEKSLDDKFKEYEEFLRKNLGLDDDDLKDDAEYSDDDFVENLDKKYNKNENLDKNSDENFDLDENFANDLSEDFADDFTDFDDDFDDNSKNIKRNLTNFQQNSTNFRPNSQSNFNPYADLRHNIGNVYSNSKALDNNALDAVANFDFNAVRGKTNGEILEMIKNLPPRAQEIILTDILARRMYDEEN